MQPLRLSFVVLSRQKPNFIRTNYNYYGKRMFDICKFFLASYLLFEVLLFTTKLHTFDLAKCISEEVNLESNCTNFRVNATFQHNAREYCWTHGFYKKRFFVQGPNPRDVEGHWDPQNHRLYLSVDSKYARKRDCYRIEYEENDAIRKTAMLIYGFFLVLIALYVCQRKVDAYRPIVDQLRDRNILEYCPFDRKKLESLILYAIRNLRFRYYLIVFIQSVYQGLLVALILLIKMVLYGYKPFDSFTSDQLLFFPNTTNTSVVDLSNDYNEGADILYSEQQFAKQLHWLFTNSWYVFLVLLAVYGMLLCVCLIQCASPTLRTKTILAFIPDIDIGDGAKGEQTYRLLTCLNSKVHIFYFLYEIVCLIDQFHFSIILDQLDLLNDDSKTQEEPNKDKPPKVEDAKAGSTKVSAGGDVADHQKSGLSSSAPTVTSLANPVYLTDWEDQQRKSRAHEVIDMPTSTVGVLADVHQPLDSGHFSNDGQPDSDANPAYLTTDREDRQSKDQHLERIDLNPKSNLATHSNGDQSLDKYSSDVHHQSDQPSDNRVE